MYLGGAKKDAADNNGAGNGVLQSEADCLAKDLGLVVAAWSVVGRLLQCCHKALCSGQF